MTESARPPADLLAEALALDTLLAEPRLIETADLGPMSWSHKGMPLLWAQEHRACWQAMVRVRMRDPALLANPTEFFLAWRRELCAMQCVAPSRVAERHGFWEDGRCDAKALWWSLAQARETELQRVRFDPGRQTLICALPGHQPHAAGAHDLDFWLGRLRTCAEARQLIDTAQQIAEQAWRQDVGAARAIAARAVRTHAALEGMDIPV